MELKDLPLELEESQARALDELFYANKSIVKKSTLLSTVQDLDPNQATYLATIIVDELVVQGNPSHLLKLFKGLDFENINVLMAIALAQCFKVVEPLLENSGTISHAFTNCLLKHNIAYEKL